MKFKCFYCKEETIFNEYIGVGNTFHSQSNHRIQIYSDGNLYFDLISPNDQRIVLTLTSSVLQINYWTIRFSDYKYKQYSIHNLNKKFIDNLSKIYSLLK